jgi:FG-GAP-like repeat
VALVVLLTGCTSWEDVRDGVIHPANHVLHRELPGALRDHNPDALAALCLPEVQEAARADAVELLAPFAFVEFAHCLIEDAELDDDVLTAQCLLKVDGVDADERRLTVEQRREYVLQRVVDAETALANPHDGSSWRITGFRVFSSDLQQEEGPGPAYADETTQRGLVFHQTSRGVVDRGGVVQSYLAGSGLALGDIDGDGYDDVLMVGGGELRLFRNRQGTFSDETEARGITAPPTGELRCGYFADIDNDRDPDLFVGLVNGPNLLFKNERGRYRLVPESESGLTSTEETASACFADFDQDGDLDLYIVNGRNLYVDDPDPIYNAKNAVANQYFRNRGDGTFEDLTEESGADDPGWGLGCTTTDYDLDGDVDLFVANDFGPDLLYRNRGDGTFEDVSDEAGIIYRGSAMSADAGDVNGDGYPDIYISGMASNSRWMARMPSFPVPLTFPLSVIFRGVALDAIWEMLHGNRLYMNQQDGTFREVSAASQTQFAFWGWAAVMFDHDNDGDLDIYAVNGFYSGEKPDDL